MNFPTLTYQVDFAHDPASGSFTWTDLTSRALAFSCTRGRSHEQATVDAGSAAIEWKNTDGALDPTNTGGAYYPNVIPYRRVQVKATWSGTPYNIYTGVVERWPMQWQDEFGTVPTQCTDTFAILANKILSVGYEHEVLADSPAVLFPFADSSPSTTVANRVDGGGLLTAALSAAGGGDLTFGSAALTAAETAGTALSMNQTLTSAAGDDLKGYYFTGPTIAALGSTFTFEAWVKIDANLLAAMGRNTNAGLPNPVPLVCVTDADGNVTGGLAIHDLSGALILAHLTAANAANTWTATWMSPSWSIDLNDGKAHHLAISCSAGTATFYVDGVQIGSSSGGIPAMTAGSLQLGGYVPSNWVYGLAPDYRGSIQHAAVYQTALSSGQVAAHYSAGATGFAGDTADARIARILSYAGWTGATSLDACTTTMLPIAGINGQSALAAIQTVEASEGGTFYEGKDGTLTYRSRTTRMSTTASAYTFGDGTSELPYVSVAFDFDPTFIYNDIQIQRDGASAYYLSNATSQGHYGQRTYAKTLSIQSDTEVVDAANWILTEYSDPHLRVSSMTLDPAANPALWPAVLNMDIGTRVTVKRRPHGSSNTISADFFVEQLTHNVQPGAWIATVALSPIALQALIANDATFGICDSTFVAAY